MRQHPDGRKTLILATAAALAFTAAMAFADDPVLHLECKVMVPQRFLQTTATPRSGEPERIRYSQAYEAYWWNCVAVMSSDMNEHCPLAASGTPAASAGATNGATAAMNGIADLIKKYGTAKVQAYLKQLASPPSMLEDKLHGYFHGTPTGEPSPQA